MTFANSVYAANFFKPGDIYASSSENSVDRIHHYTSSGVYVDSITLPDPDRSREVRGITFGPDSLLYVVFAKSSGFIVEAYDSNGLVKASYSGQPYAGVNISYGKITFAKNGKFFVAARDNLVAFTQGSIYGEIIYTNNQVFDVVALPSGNLLVLSAYEIEEITTSGAVVKKIPTESDLLTDARGIEYDSTTNDIFVTMLGHTGQFFMLMRLNGATGAMEKSNSFWYGDDLFLTSDRRIIVGSRTQAPGIFDTDVVQKGVLGRDEEQMFITQMSPSLSVDDPDSGSVAVNFTGMTVEAGSYIQSGQSVPVTVSANSSDNSSVYYKFYYCGNYGTSDYSNTPWTMVQDYSSKNSCNYTFPTDGSYIVTVRGVTDPDNEPARLSLIGGVVNIGNNNGYVNISSYNVSADTDISSGDVVTVTVNASAQSRQNIYYKFFYCGNYGSDSYSTTPWTTVQDYSISNRCFYVFPDAGSYIVVARAVTDPQHEPAALPIAGGVINVNSN